MHEYLVKEKEWLYLFGPWVLMQDDVTSSVVETAREAVEEAVKGLGSRLEEDLAGALARCDAGAIHQPQLGAYLSTSKVIGAGSSMELSA